jgi:hypothetical protein
MVYDPKLAERIRSLVAGRHGVTEKEMFGGLAFLKDGRMFCCVLGRELLARVGPAAEGAAKVRPHARRLDLVGYAVSGCVIVQPGGLATDAALGWWLEECEGQAAAQAEKPKMRPSSSLRTAQPGLQRERRTGSRRR